MLLEDSDLIDAMTDQADLKFPLALEKLNPAKAWT